MWPETLLMHPDHEIRIEAPASYRQGWLAKAVCKRTLLAVRIQLWISQRVCVVWV